MPTLPASLIPTPRSPSLDLIEARALAAGDVVVDDGALFEVSDVMNFGREVHISGVLDGVTWCVLVAADRVFHRAGRLNVLRLPC